MNRRCLRRSWLTLAASGAFLALSYFPGAAALAAKASTAVSSGPYLNGDSSVVLTPMTTMNGMPVMTPMVQAAATHVLDPVYQFWWQGPNGHWTSGGNYSSRSMMTVPPYAVSPDHAGNYHVVVYAKSANAPEAAANEVWSQVLTVMVSPTVDFSLTPSLSAMNVGSSADLTLAQVYTNGKPASGMSLDNLDSTLTVTGPNGDPATGFTISGFGVANQTMVQGKYTFDNAPTVQSGSLVITAGAGVAPGTYYVTASDPDHMNGTSLPVALVVNP